MATRRILVVDGDKRYSSEFQRELEEGGFEVVIAESGREALGHADSNYDVAVFDYRLSDATGLDLLWCLRTQGATYPVIVVASRPRPEIDQAAGAAGARAFLKKPHQPREVVDAVLEIVASQVASQVASPASLQA